MATTKWKLIWCKYIKANKLQSWSEEVAATTFYYSTWFKHFPYTYFYEPERTDRKSIFEMSGGRLWFDENNLKKKKEYLPELFVSAFLFRAVFWTPSEVSIFGNSVVTMVVDWNYRKTENNTQKKKRNHCRWRFPIVI